MKQLLAGVVLSLVSVAAFAAEQFLPEGTYRGSQKGVLEISKDNNTVNSYTPDAQMCPPTKGLITYNITGNKPLLKITLNGPNNYQAQGNLNDDGSFTLSGNPRVLYKESTTKSCSQLSNTSNELFKKY